MPTFYDSQNQPIALGERLGSGGEGTVYSCETSGLVAKIYYEPITDAKAEKLRWMAANQNDQLLKVAAWVVDVLQDQPNGKVVGFLMPNVKAKEIHELYSLKSRRVYFPEATWQFLVHTAGNLARAFHNLHKNSHIMGDVNHGNCVVLADGTVKLIDCDSYSIKIGDTRHRCEVGVATHLAPELQGADLSEVERKETHDNFGLAVIIFQLLFLGRHPFAGNYLGEEDKSIEDCIREYLFAYGDNAQKYKVAQPPGTLSLSKISPAVAALFNRAFLTFDRRPEPREWIEALADLSDNLEQCALHPGHFYFNELKSCPWCEIEGQTGLMLFPFVTNGSQTDGEKPFNIFTVENLITSFGIGQNLPAKPPALLDILPAPTAKVAAAKRESRKMMIVSISLQFFGLIFLMVIFGVGIAFFIGMGSMMFWLVYLNNSSKYLREEVQYELAKARQDWDGLEDQWTHSVLPQSLDNSLVTVRKKVADYQKFQQDRIREAKAMQDGLERRELFQHLRSIELEDAEIEGFAEQERQWLVGKGIKTAAEVTENRIRGFHDFNGELVPRLLEWRNKIELEYAAAPRLSKFQNEREEFVKETARERRRIEMDIEHSLTILRSGAVNLRRQQQHLTSKSTEIAARLLQSRSNAEFLGSGSPTIVILVLITILTPYFGFIISQINAPPTNYTNGRSYTEPPPKISVVLNNSTDNLKIPDENITDQEIARLSGSQRSEYAVNLFSQATSLAYSSYPDYAKAERKMRLVVRLQDNDVSYLNQLGYVLYEQGKCKEALKYLTQSLAINDRNTSTKTFLARNYLKMEQFYAARAQLDEVVKQYPGSFEGNYYLGLAHKGLKDYESAVKFLEKAAEIGKDDVNTHYQLAICFTELAGLEKDDRKYQEKAFKEFNEVERLDSAKAGNLANEIELINNRAIKPAVDR